MATNSDPLTMNGDSDPATVNGNSDPPTVNGNSDPLTVTGFLNLPSAWRKSLATSSICAGYFLYSTRLPSSEMR